MTTQQKLRRIPFLGVCLIGPCVALIAGYFQGVNSQVDGQAHFFASFAPWVSWFAKEPHRLVLVDLDNGDRKPKNGKAELQVIKENGQYHVLVYNNSGHQTLNESNVTLPFHLKKRLSTAFKTMPSATEQGMISRHLKSLVNFRPSGAELRNVRHAISHLTHERHEFRLAAGLANELHGLLILQFEGKERGSIGYAISHSTASTKSQIESTLDGVSLFHNDHAAILRESVAKLTPTAKQARLASEQASKTRKAFEEGIDSLSK